MDFIQISASMIAWKIPPPRPPQLYRVLSTAVQKFKN